MFLRIVNDVKAKNSYFIQKKKDAVGHMGFTSIHRLLVAMRMLAYGGPSDALDDTFAMSESTVTRTLLEFVQTVIDIYEEEYLRPPRAREVQVILRQNEARGFPGMIGSIDCMHWEWGNCPTAWAGVYKGSHNDINVLHRFPVFDELATGRTLEVEYWVNGNPYTMGYYLADKIYPNWATLVKTVSAPASMKQDFCNHSRIVQERCGERLWSTAKKIQYHIQPSNDVEPQKNLMQSCVLDERDICRNPEDTEGFEGNDDPSISINRDVPEISTLIDTYNCIRVKETCSQLQQDLIEHIWSQFGASTDYPTAINLMNYRQ
ncbi:hypothetical protein U9M48_021670 [Paspalum notatum var. saurae]|uniref:Nuclease HARBI1 n=1 Tax=Paspalum notatum var. saurae TaxID=547442 RepID=A0AAQ3TI22_PASNO